jgi:hypothetical protein
MLTHTYDYARGTWLDGHTPREDAKLAPWLSARLHRAVNAQNLSKAGYMSRELRQDIDSVTPKTTHPHLGTPLYVDATKATL